MVCSDSRTRDVDDDDDEWVLKLLDIGLMDAPRSRPSNRETNCATAMFSEKTMGPFYVDGWFMRMSTRMGQSMNLLIPTQQ